MYLFGLLDTLRDKPVHENDIEKKREKDVL